MQAKAYSQSGFLNKTKHETVVQDDNEPGRVRRKLNNSIPLKRRKVSKVERNTALKRILKLEEDNYGSEGRLVNSLASPSSKKAPLSDTGLNPSLHPVITALTN